MCIEGNIFLTPCIMIASEISFRGQVFSTVAFEHCSCPLFLCLARYRSITVIYSMNHGSLAGIATGYGLDDRGVGVGVLVSPRIFTSSYRPDRLWEPTSSFPQGCKAAGVVKVITDLQLGLRLRKR
jgi:hypothetical protein